MQNVRVNSWRELTGEALYEIPRNSHGRHRSDFVYRGDLDAAWRPDTSLRRLGDDDASRGALSRTFWRCATPGAIPGNLLWVTHFPGPDGLSRWLERYYGAGLGY